MEAFYKKKAIVLMLKLRNFSNLQTQPGPDSDFKVGTNLSCCHTGSGS